MGNKNRNLILLNYQYEIPPFLIAFLQEGVKHYDKIYYITPKLKRDNSDFLSNINVELHQVNKILKYYFLFIVIFTTPFRKHLRDNAFQAIKSKNISFQIVNTFLQQSVCGYMLSSRATKIIKNRNLNNGQLDIIAAWFSAEAFAASILKTKFSNCHTYSFAHSYDANPFRNPNLMYNFIKFKHQNLNNIYFISSTIRNYYMDNIARTYDLKDSNISLQKLGVSNKFNKLSRRSDDKVLRILSVSSVNAIKQVIEIPMALQKIKNVDIEWTHIGEGPLFYELQKYIRIVTRDFKRIKISLLGYKQNKDVHKFYLDNAVDIFINISKVEGVPVSIMEAISFGVPVIATDVGGTQEVVKEDFGFLLNPNNINSELSTVLKKFINLDNDYIRNLRYNAREFWANNFDSDKNYYDFFKSITSKEITYE